MSIFITLIILWIASEAFRDAEDINEGDYINDHTSRTINRVIVGLLTACIAPFYGIITLLLFWTFFDIILNIFRGLPIGYIGSVSNSDKWAVKNKNKYHLTKFFSLIIAIVIIYSVK